MRPCYKPPANVAPPQPSRRPPGAGPGEHSGPPTAPGLLPTHAARPSTQRNNPKTGVDGMTVSQILYSFSFTKWGNRIFQDLTVF